MRTRSTFILRGNRSGAAYLLAVTTLLVGTIFALAMLRSTSAGFRSEDIRQKKLAAVNVAEAGVDYAYWQVHYNGKGLPYSATVSLSGGSFSVSAADDGGRDRSAMLITSTGTVGRHSSTIKRVTLGLLPYHYGWCEGRPLGTAQNFTSSGAGRGLRSNGAISLTGLLNNVTTGAWSTSTVFGRGTVTAQYPSSPYISFPDIDYAHYASIADWIYNWNVSYSSLSGVGGVIYVNGDVEISDSYRGVWTIVSTHDILVRGNLWPADQNSYLALICDNRLHIDSWVNSVEAVLYSHDPGGTATLCIHGALPITLKGCLAADDASSDGPVTLTRDNRLSLSVMRQLKLPGL